MEIYFISIFNLWYYLSGELAAEFSGAEKSLSEAAAAGEHTGTARLINILSFLLPASLYLRTYGRGQHLGWRWHTFHLERQQGRRQEAHGRPSAGRPRRPGGRTGCQANPTGVGCPYPCAGQEEGGGEEQPDAAAAPTLPTASLAVRPAAADTGSTRARARGGRPKPLLLL